MNLPAEGQDVIFKPRGIFPNNIYRQELAAKFMEGLFICGQEAFLQNEVNYWKDSDKGEKHLLCADTISRRTEKTPEERRQRRLYTARIANAKWRAKQKALKQPKVKQTEEERKAKQAAYIKKWREKNKDKCNEYMRNYNQKKKAAKAAGTA